MSTTLPYLLKYSRLSMFGSFDRVPIAEWIWQITPEISTIISSVLGVLLAGIHGSIHLLNHNFETSKSWVAYTGGRTSHMIAREKLLITIGVSRAGDRFKCLFVDLRASGGGYFLV
jgi:hypothetical protein